MKIVKSLLIALMAFIVVACSGFNNPISNESDDLIIINQSGGSENGSGGYENG